MADENRLNQALLGQKAGKARSESIEEGRSALYGCLSMSGKVHREYVPRFREMLEKSRHMAAVATPAVHED
jgi:hypothetical protein